VRLRSLGGTFHIPSKNRVYVVKNPPRAAGFFQGKGFGLFP